MTRTLALPALLVCAHLAAQAPNPAGPALAQASPQESAMPQPQQAQNPMSDPSGRPYHLVQAGENLHGIAIAYGLTLQKVVELNHIENNTIFVGDKVWLAPLGAKVTLPTPAPGAAQAGITSQEPPAPEDRASEEEAFTFKPSAPGQGLTQGGGALVEHRAPARVLHGTIPRPVPAAQRTVLDNPASGQSLAKDSRYFRKPLPPHEPEVMPLVETVKNLPMLAKEEPRSEWTPRQLGYAEHWERQVVRSAGIPAMARWDGQNLVLALRAAQGAPPVRVVVPGAFLPPLIDTAALQRMVRAGGIFEFVGHPMYLDGQEPVRAMLKGQIMAPWGFVATVLRLRTPATNSVMALTIE